MMLAAAAPAPLLFVLCLVSVVINLVYAFLSLRGHRPTHLAQALVFEGIALWIAVGLLLTFTGTLARVPRSPFDRFIDPLRPLIYLSWSLPGGAYLVRHRARAAAGRILEQVSEELAQHRHPPNGGTSEQV